MPRLSRRRYRPNPAAISDAEIRRLGQAYIEGQDQSGTRQKESVSEYNKAVRSLRVGKHLPSDVYVHKTLVPSLPLSAQISVAEALGIAGLTLGDIDLVKLSKSKPSVSLLSYPGFWSEPFPGIVASWSVDLAAHRVTHRQYAQDYSTPILHRKEEFLAPGDPRAVPFREVTRVLEGLGLFRDLSRIGHRWVWDQMLRDANVRVEDGRVLSYVGRPRRICPSDTNDSKETSRPIVPRLHRAMQKRIWRHGDRNYDLGGGKFERATNELREQSGVTNYVDDPSRSDKHNAAVRAEMLRNPPDTVTVANVLNVICDAEARSRVIASAGSAVRSGGVVGFQIYTGDGSGSGCKTTDGWQENRKAVTYQEEIERWFGHVERRGDFFFATEPRRVPVGRLPEDHPTKVCGRTSAPRPNPRSGKRRDLRR